MTQSHTHGCVTNIMFFLCSKKNPSAVFYGRCYKEGNFLLPFKVLFRQTTTQHTFSATQSVLTQQNVALSIQKFTFLINTL